MNRVPTDSLIERLSGEAKAVEPLAPPARRAFATFAVAGAGSLALILLAGDAAGMRQRYAGQHWLMLGESAAMLTTFILAVLAAFIVAVPGRSKSWLLAPLPAFATWFALSGLGCLTGSIRPELEHSTDCLAFILGSSLVVGLPLLWRLSRAHPIDPLPVALLGGLGAAALSAFLLQFFHPFSLTLLDLGVHFGAVLLVLGLATMFRRMMLAPA